VECIQHWQKKTLLTSLCRLVFGASIYHLWKNRNGIFHVEHPNTEEQLLQRIQWDVKARVGFKGKFRKCGAAWKLGYTYRYFGIVVCLFYFVLFLILFFFIITKGI
jgi:hypothetical protein